MFDTESQQIRPTAYILTPDFNSDHIEQLIEQFDEFSIPYSMQKETDTLGLPLDRRYFVVVDNIKGTVMLGSQFSSLLMFVVGYPRKGVNKKNHYCKRATDVIQKYKLFLQLPQLQKTTYSISIVRSKTQLKTIRSAKSIPRSKQSSELLHNKSQSISSRQLREKQRQKQTTKQKIRSKTNQYQIQKISQGNKKKQSTISYPNQCPQLPSSSPSSLKLDQQSKVFLLKLPTNADKDKNSIDYNKAVSKIAVINPGKFKIVSNLYELKSQIETYSSLCHCLVVHQKYLRNFQQEPIPNLKIIVYRASNTPSNNAKQGKSKDLTNIEEGGEGVSYCSNFQEALNQIQRLCNEADEMDQLAKQHKFAKASSYPEKLQKSKMKNVNWAEQTKKMFSSGQPSPAQSKNPSKKQIQPTMPKQQKDEFERKMLMIKQKQIQNEKQRKGQEQQQQHQQDSKQEYEKQSQNIQTPIVNSHHDTYDNAICSYQAKNYPSSQNQIGELDEHEKVAVDLSRTDPDVRDSSRFSKQMKDLDDIEQQYLKTGGSHHSVPTQQVQQISFKNLQPTRIRTLTLTSPQTKMQSPQKQDFQLQLHSQAKTKVQPTNQQLNQNLVKVDMQPGENYYTEQLASQGRNSFNRINQYIGNFGTKAKVVRKSELMSASSGLIRADVENVRREIQNFVVNHQAQLNYQKQIFSSIERIPQNNMIMGNQRLYTLSKINEQGQQQSPNNQMSEVTSPQKSKLKRTIKKIKRVKTQEQKMEQSKGTQASQPNNNLPIQKKQRETHQSTALTESTTSLLRPRLVKQRLLMPQQYCTPFSPASQPRIQSTKQMKISMRPKRVLRCRTQSPQIKYFDDDGNSQKQKYSIMRPMKRSLIYKLVAIQQPNSVLVGTENLDKMSPRFSKSRISPNSQFYGYSSDSRGAIGESQFNLFIDSKNSQKALSSSGFLKSQKSIIANRVASDTNCYTGRFFKPSETAIAFNTFGSISPLVLKKQRLTTPSKAANSIIIQQNPSKYIQTDPLSSTSSLNSSILGQPQLTQPICILWKQFNYDIEQSIKKLRKNISTFNIRQYCFYRVCDMQKIIKMLPNRCKIIVVLDDVAVDRFLNCISASLNSQYSGAFDARLEVVGVFVYQKERIDNVSILGKSQSMTSGSILSVVSANETLNSRVKYIPASSCVEENQQIEQQIYKLIVQNGCGGSRVEKGQKRKSAFCRMKQKKYETNSSRSSRCIESKTY